MYGTSSGVIFGALSGFRVLNGGGASLGGACKRPRLGNLKIEAPVGPGVLLGNLYQESKNQKEKHG